MSAKWGIAKLGLGLTLVVLAAPASAPAQATRTWVSGVGDDANPCSRTAPCKTFAGAISKTAAGGIIMPMDDGGFGAVTITKPITIDGGKHQAGLLASGGVNGTIVNIDPAVQPANFVNNGKVVLKNLKFEGNTSIPSAGGFSPGLNGVRIINAKTVKLYNVDIGFFSRSGVDVEPTATTTTTVVVKHSEIHDNDGAGVMAAPATNAVARLSVHGNALDENRCGIAATQFGPSNAFATNCGTNAPNAATGVSVVNAFNNEMFGSGTNTVLANGGLATVRIGGNAISGSLGPALTAINGGQILTWNDNSIAGNPGGNGASTGGITPLKQVARKAR